MPVHLRVEPCLDPIRIDGVQAPPAAAFERCPQLLLTDRMRATGTRSDVTETEHVQAAQMRGGQLRPLAHDCSSDLRSASSASSSSSNASARVARAQM